MHPRPDICEACPAFRIGQSYVPGVGPTHPKAILLGQGPGKAEATMGVPFVGPAGAKLDRWLARSTGWCRDEVWIDNTVRCWLPRDRVPTAKEIAFCRRHHWESPLLERLGSRLLDDGTSAVLLITLGASATKAILGSQAGERWFGSLELININVEAEAPPSMSATYRLGYTNITEVKVEEAFSSLTTEQIGEILVELANKLKGTPCS